MKSNSSVESFEGHIDANDCRDLWVAVVKTGLCDALRPSRNMRYGTGLPTDQWQADAWIRHSEDFKVVCGLAGMNADMWRKLYIEGKLEYTMFTRVKETGS